MKNRGFTLVELLAVILVLAIILLITIPIVSELVLNASDEADMRSADLYIDAVNLALVNKNMSSKLVNTRCTVISGGNLDCGGITVEVDIDKKAPESGTIIVRKMRVSDVQNLKIGDFYFNYDSDKKLVASENPGEVANVDTCVWGAEGEYNIVTCGEETFYAMYQDGNDITMLSKYNLDVGNVLSNCDEAHNWACNVNPIENPTGIQKQEALGYYEANDADVAYGTVAFSNENYWSGGASMASYTKDNNAYVKPLVSTSDFYNYVYSEDSNIYQYIENYKAYLSGLGITVKEARLLSAEEAHAVMNYLMDSGGDSASSRSYSGENGNYIAVPLTSPQPVHFDYWLNSTSYWLGSADNDYVYCIYKGSTEINNNYYGTNDTYGIRPTLVIQASQISGTPTYEVVDIATLMGNNGGGK